jgi:hypothetical protein
MRERGAEGANPDHLGTKLSGKRTVIYLNPGKPPGLTGAPMGTNPEFKRQEEGDIN